MSTAPTTGKETIQVEKNKESFTLENDIIIKEVEYPTLSQYTKHVFDVPSKRIASPDDVNVFLKSNAYKKLNQFLQDLAKSIESKKTTSTCSISPVCQGILKLLADVDQLIEDTPALPHDTAKSRYGNKAYRTWHDELEKASLNMLNRVFPESWLAYVSSGDKEKEEKNKNDDKKNKESLTKTLENMKRELNVYLLGSFGDKTRIDYGTGHELCFMALLCCLFELKLLTTDDFPCIVLRIFHRYISLMRKLQIKYLLEPAGSRGVWGLDDYQFLPFYFGASQLIGEPDIKPSHILNPKVLEKGPDYLYLECIAFILKMKTGVFAEHSPLLNDISGVPEWSKVKNGLYKMYQDDVFKKFPVIQHFFFGSILTVELRPVTSKMSSEDEVLERKKALIAKLNAQRGITDREKTGKSPTKTGVIDPPLEITGVAPWARPDAVDLVYSTKGPWTGDSRMEDEDMEEEPINMPLPLNPTKKGPPEHGSLKSLHQNNSPTTSNMSQFKAQLEEQKEKENQANTKQNNSQ